MKRTAKSQLDHDILVKRVVEHLKRQGYRNIRADLPGYPQPEMIEGTKQDHIPDLTADGVTADDVIVEVETADSITSDHSASQFYLFAAYANNSDMEFWVVVPEGVGAAADRCLSELGISAKVYTA